MSLPAPRCPITIRPATMDDLSFIDRLQKMHNKMVGFMPEKALEGKIKLGHVVIAEEPSPQPSPGVPGEGERVGYCIGNDQYFKRDDLGIIYQMNVVPEKQRGLIGAMLVQAMFDRAAYGCKLFCCWCAQDIEANRFWESLGFIALAFRAGSRQKSRVHIFWQKRIRQGDTTTPWWFPSQTTGGSMMEDRLVFPIPPGTHWSDAKPIILPGAGPAQIADKKPGRDARATIKPALDITLISSGGLRPAIKTSERAIKPRRERRPKQKNDPKLIAAARELRDRWLEHVNQNENALPEPCGKYALCRTSVSSAQPQIESTAGEARGKMPALAA